MTIDKLKYDLTLRKSPKLVDLPKNVEFLRLVKDVFQQGRYSVHRTKLDAAGEIVFDSVQRHTATKRASRRFMDIS